MLQPRSRTWYDQTLLNGPDDLWLECLRLDRATLNKVLDMVKGDMEPSDVCVREPVPVHKRVTIAVFKIASCAEYRVIGKHMQIILRMATLVITNAPINLLMISKLKRLNLTVNIYFSIPFALETRLFFICESTKIVLNNYHI